jgi:hypothetical protein
MANIFKLKTKASVTNEAISHSNALTYTVPADTHTVVLGISLANITSGSVTADVRVVSNTADTETNTDTYLGKNLPIPAGGTLEIMQGNKLVLEDTDALRIRASASSSIDALISIMEIT